MPSPSPFDPMKPTPQQIDIPQVFKNTTDDGIAHLLAPIQPKTPFSLLGQLKDTCDPKRFKDGKWQMRIRRIGDDSNWVRIISTNFPGDLGIAPIRNLGGDRVDLSIVAGDPGMCTVMHKARNGIVAPYTTAIIDTNHMTLVSICLGELIKPSQIEIETVSNAGFKLGDSIKGGDATNLEFEFAAIEMAPR